MDAFKAQFERIKQQLAALTATQKMLVAALVAVMVLTMLYWGRYAGNAEMVSVVDQPLTAEEVGPIDRQLRLAEIPHQIDGVKVLVPADRKDDAFASLMYAEALPQNTQSAFEVMTSKLNPFSPSSDRDAAYNQATAMELSRMIGRWKGVASANVIINAKNDRHIGGDIPPSATVNIITRGTIDDPKQMVRAAAEGVAHAVSGLKPSEISVIVDGVSKKVNDSTNDPLASGSDLLDLRRRSEAELEEKVAEQYQDIKGFRVTVNCDVENKTTHEKNIGYQKDKSYSSPIQQDEHTEETTNTPPRGEPGVASNTGGANGSISIDGGSGGGGESNTSNISDTHTTTGNYVGSSETSIDTLAGKDIAQSATVRVPVSYFAAAFKIAQSIDKNQTDLAKFTDQKLASIRDGVKNIINLKTDESVSVTSYEDLPPEILASPIASLPGATLNTVGGHAKEIALGVLAIVSLFLMASMVRKATPASIILPQVAGANGPTAGGVEASTFGGEQIAGEVGAGDAALDGMELNDEDVRTQQMLDQVTTMVKENPDNAAALVKRWLSRP